MLLRCYSFPETGCRQELNFVFHRVAANVQRLNPTWESMEIVVVREFAKQIWGIVASLMKKSKCKT